MRIWNKKQHPKSYCILGKAKFASCSESANRASRVQSFFDSVTYIKFFEVISFTVLDKAAILFEVRSTCGKQSEVQISNRVALLARLTQSRLHAAALKYLGPQNHSSYRVPRTEVQRGQSSTLWGCATPKARDPPLASKGRCSACRSWHLRTLPYLCRRLQSVAN